LFVVLLSSHWIGKVQRKFSELYFQSLIHCKALKLKNIKKHPIKCVLIFFLKLCSELTIEDKVLKIFIVLLIPNLNLTKTQTPFSEIYLIK